LIGSGAEHLNGESETRRAALGARPDRAKCIGSGVVLEVVGAGC